MLNKETAIVLIVEDEPLIRLAAVDIIEDAGFAVLEASDADEALSLLERYHDIGIVFSDIEMPGSMNGMKLACQIRERWPSIEIILTSGQGIAPQFAMPSRGVFLAKPYRPAELRSHLDLIAA